MPTSKEKHERPFFNAENLPEPTAEYVCWVDVMGTQAALSQSLPRAANFFAKIHLAALKTAGTNICLYPVMDGIYVTCPSRVGLLKWLRAFFRLHAIIFCAETDHGYRYLIRGSIVYGPVIHGRQLIGCCDFSAHSGYQGSLLLGMPMIQANQSERLAPPFGLFVHESARAFSPSGEAPFTTRWLIWWKGNDKSLIEEIRGILPDYFQWAKRNSHIIDYPLERIAEHRALADEYFAMNLPW